MPPARAGALSHLVVLDLTQFLAGPYCTQIFADLGARVIKVEPPEGDMTRTLPPHFVRGSSAYYLSVNRSKESVVLDLKQPEGRDLFLRLVRSADVVAENFRPGVMRRLGLDYAQLAEVNPGVVVCSVSGFGQDGPEHQAPAYDIIVQALSGVMSVTGVPGAPPVRAGVPIGDLAAGMFGAIGVLAALLQREVTGRGQHVDVAMLDSQISLLSYLGVYFLVSGEVPAPQGRGHVSIPTYRSFTCADGVDVVVAANTERMWQGLCAVLGCPELAADARFATNELRLRNREALWPVLESAFRQRPAEDWLVRLRRESVPAARVNSVDRALASIQAQHRSMTVTVQHPDGTPLRLLGNPVKLSQAGDGAFGWPPELGEHTEEVLRELVGLSAEQVADLVAAGVVAPRPVTPRSGAPPLIEGST